MTNKQTTAQQERAERLAAVLRDNLKKRKARARAATPEGDTDRTRDDA